MRKIVWADEAVEHIEPIGAYIATFNLAAAIRLGKRLIEVADSLAKSSDRGRDASERLREMTTVWPYHPTRLAWRARWNLMDAWRDC